MTITAKAAKDLLDRYSQAWTDNDSAAIASHWQGDDEAVFYKAEEISDVFSSFDEITAYWAHNEKFHEKVRLVFDLKMLNPLPGGYAIGFIAMRWDIAFKADQKTFEGEDFNHGGKAMGGENHTLIMLRDAGAGPKFVGWSETPDAPITYMAKLYEWAASPDFRKG